MESSQGDSQEADRKHNVRRKPGKLITNESNEHTLRFTGKA